MPMFTIHSMMTMQYVPKPDWRLFSYGVSWLVVIATAMACVAVYA